MTQSPELAWRCGVCGYIHRGPTPPDFCPVCGADRGEFEPYAPPLSPATPTPARGWRCLNCNYLHDADSPPDECPVCGASREHFARPDAAPAAALTSHVGCVVVVGACIAGLSAVEAVRQASPDTRIVLVSKEVRPPYYRLNLTRYLAGQTAREELPLHPPVWYADNRVELLLGREVTAISPAEHSLTLAGGQSLAYDKLILAAGAHPFVPPLPGADRPGVMSLRTVDDADAILAAARPGSHVVCIGGGILGIETAAALAARGARVALLEAHRFLMPRQLNQRAGELLAHYVANAGIQLLTQAKTREITGSDRVSGVSLEDGRTLQADLVVLATGVRSNTHLARKAGLEVNQGVVVDNHLATSDPDILAAGDVCEHHGLLYGNWAAAQYQGSIAGMNAAGLAVEFGGIPRSNTLKVLGVDMVSTGLVEPPDGSYTVLESESPGRYLRFLLHDCHLVGAILLGEASLAGRIKKAIETRQDFSSLAAPRATVAAVVELLSA